MVLLTVHKHNGGFPMMVVWLPELILALINRIPI